MDIPLLISSLAAAKDMAALLVDERDRQKAVAIQIQLTEKILQAQAQLAEVLGAVIEKDAATVRLAERCRELEAAQSEKARYQLAELMPGGHVFAYRLRARRELTERQDEVPHFLCQPCFDGGHKSVLAKADSMGRWVYSCRLCKCKWSAGPSNTPYLDLPAPGTMA